MGLKGSLDMVPSDWVVPQLSLVASTIERMGWLRVPVLMFR